MQNDWALSLLIDRNKKFRDILIYVEKNSDGEKIDRWLPMRPEELRWRYLRVNFDQLKI